MTLTHRVLNARRRRQGFTLFEIILAVALMALFGAMFVINIQTMLQQSEGEVLEDEFWNAVDQARQRSVFQKRKYVLSFSEEENSFTIRSGSQSEKFEVDTARFEPDTEVSAVFYEVLPKDGYKLIRGELVSTRDVESVSFFPDGTCTPFSVNLKIGDNEASYHIDPWTGAQLITKGDED